MKTLSMGMSALLLLLLLSDGVAAQAPALNARCPIQPDQPATDEFVLDYKGQRIAFCCRMCRVDFLADPQPALALLAEWAAQEAAEDESAAAERPPGEPSAEAAAAGAPVDLVERVARFHVLAVHFPIGLILAATLAELLLMRRRTPGLAAARHFCLGLGAAGAVVAAVLGWLLAETRGVPPSLAEKLFWHRWLGVSAAALALGAWRLSRASGEDDRPGARVALLAAALVVGFAGHYGAQLVYGLDYFG